MTSKLLAFLSAVVLYHSCSVTSFLPASPTAAVARVSSTSSPPTQLFMAGFGGGGGGNQKKATLPKLKAKTQWDRYADLKLCKKVRVGVKLSGEGGWMEVGKVRSENNEYTSIAIARQRSLIADHAKRLYPVQIPMNSVLEWGFIEGDGDDGTWVAVDKSSGDNAPKGIEKKFGFEGISDKASGFYCYYHEGRIVEREDEGKGKKTSVVK